MSDPRDPDQQVTERLARLGAQPVPDTVRSSHLHRLAAVTPDAAPPKRFGRVAVAAAAIVGFLAGSSGFAVAGALPDPAQGVAHDVFSVLQVEVPDRGNGPPDFILEDDCKGPPPWALEKRRPTPEEQQRFEDLRASEQCADDGGEGRPDGAGPPDRILEDDCKGPPPWAREDREPTPEEQEAFRDLRSGPQCTGANGAGGGGRPGATAGPGEDAGPPGEVPAAGPGAEAESGG